jgi:thioredoxin reductase (NADPH)
VVVLGNDDKAARTTLQFCTYTRRLTLLVEPGAGRLGRLARDKLVAAGVRILHCRIREAHEADGGLALALDDGSACRTDYLFSLLGWQPRTRPLEGLSLERARNGHLRVDDKNRTSLPGLFAAGDVSNRHSHQVASAVHEGAMAAQAANQVLYPPFQKL